MLLFPYIFPCVLKSLVTTAFPAQTKDGVNWLVGCLLRVRNKIDTVSWSAVFAVEKSVQPKEVVGTDCGMSVWRVEQYEI